MVVILQEKCNDVLETTVMLTCGYNVVVISVLTAQKRETYLTLYVETRTIYIYSIHKVQLVNLLENLVKSVVADSLTRIWVYV